MDSKEYYAPIITPYEAQLAFTPGAELGQEYRLDFESLLDEGQQPRTVEAGKPAEPRFSLIDSQQYEGARKEEEDTSSTALSLPQVKDLSRVDESKKHLIEVPSHRRPSSSDPSCSEA